MKRARKLPHWSYDVLRTEIESDANRNSRRVKDRWSDFYPCGRSRCELKIGMVNDHDAGVPQEPYYRLVAEDVDGRQVAFFDISREAWASLCWEAEDIAKWADADLACQRDKIAERERTKM